MDVKIALLVLHVMVQMLLHVPQVVNILLTQQKNVETHAQPLPKVLLLYGTQQQVHVNVQLAHQKKVVQVEVPHAQHVTQ